MAKEIRKVVIDGNRLNRKKHVAYRGVGTVSCNNSSRLLMDYKTEHPDRYQEIMKWLFDPEQGMGLTHVKIELGADINSSSGTEPATKRTKEEPANVSRGAGFMFAADAKKINPDVTADLLRWGQVGWVDKAFLRSKEAGYEARYQWYKETIDAAYDRWGLRFDYISADMNETGEVDAEWIKYLAKHLKEEKEGRYDYGSFRIVASDEVGSLCIADAMLEDEELRNAVDVIGSHYNTKGNENTRILTDKYGKEIWYSEGSAPMNDEILYASFDGSGLTGINGTLDIANRMINMYYNGEMTMYEFQPAVAAYYDGVQYFPKQLIRANTPWSGSYYVGSGAAMVRHFTSFISKGWRYIEGACFGDGNEEHYITDTTHNYLTCADEKTGDYSMVICNDSDTERRYELEVKNLKKQASPVQVWETKGPEMGQAYDACYLRQIDEILPKRKLGQVTDEESYNYTVTIKPYSLVTLTTTTGQKSYKELVEASHVGCMPREQRLLLPYTDDFTYNKDIYQTEDILEAGGYHVSRGGTPRYMTDQYGAFEVVKQNGKEVLEQQITEEIMPSTWRFGTIVEGMDIEDLEAQDANSKDLDIEGLETQEKEKVSELEKKTLPDPKVCFGDDTWLNYQVSAKIKFDKEGTERNYIGIGVRCNLSMGLEDSRTKEGTGQSGYWLKFSQDGRWRINKAFSVKLAEGITNTFMATDWIPVTLKINGQHLVAYIADQKIADIQIEPAWTGAGKVSLYSAYYKNSFADIEVLPLQKNDKDFPEGVGSTYIDRVDTWDKSVILGQGFKKNPSQSWMYYNRVNIEGNVQEKEPLPTLTFSFKGTGLHIVGETEPAVLRIIMDGEVIEDKYQVTGCAARMTSYICYGLPYGEHTMHIEVLEGNYRIDVFEIC